MSMAKAVKKTKRVTSQTIREKSKRDTSPNWDGALNWSSDEYANRYRLAMDYYRLEYAVKDLKVKVIEWMNKSGEYTKDTVRQFKTTKEWRCNPALGSVAACLLKGMPDKREDFNKGRSSTAWLKDRIGVVIQEGQNDIEEDEENQQAKVSAPVINIQDRIREQAIFMSEELDYAVDKWIDNADEFNASEFKIVNLLRGKGCKAAQARYIKGFYQNEYAELQELASGNADEQLRENYNKHSRKNVKKLIEFYESVITACDQIAAEAKVLKKPRIKKAKPAEELVKKIKFRLSDDKLGIASVPPAGIIGAQSVVVYNTKNRKFGVYISATSDGLAVKGTSITNFTKKSFQKTLRKPAEQLKDFKEQNTQKRVETWFGKIKSVETALNGRINSDIVILKVFK